MTKEKGGQQHQHHAGYPVEIQVPK